MREGGREWERERSYDKKLDTFLCSENIEELMKEFLEYPVLEDISLFYTANKDTYKV